jgi:hypothetical protein
MERAIDISSDRVTAYIAYRRAEGAANPTINRELAALKRAFNLAHEVGKVNPPVIHLLHEANARKGFFEEDEFHAVLAHLPNDLKPVVQVAFITSWRVDSEILTRSH